MASSSSLLLVALAAFFCCAAATDVAKCAAGPSPVKVDIVGCEKEPCSVVDGTDAVMDVTFVVPSDTAVLTPKVRATVGPITITYPLPGDMQDACKSLINGYCPLEKGETIVYKLKMPIGGFPKIGFLLEFSLLGEKDEVFQCFKVNCKVVAAPSSRQLD